MAAIELKRRAVERIWGRNAFPPPFEALGGGAAPIGEIWFEPPEGRADLLVKYLFTSDRLSVQVHPDAERARALGLGCGKDEAWLILEAEPGATIGLGLREPLDRERLRSAALSGEIERLLDWRPVRAGEILYAPAGTIHAIGAGLSLVEIQQNCDVTYRLYDYGRPRELQLEEAVSAARPEPYALDNAPRRIDEGRSVHVEGGEFVLERWTGGRSAQIGAGVTLVPLADGAALDGLGLSSGSVWTTIGTARLDLAPDSDLLLAYPGAEARP